MEALFFPAAFVTSVSALRLRVAAVEVVAVELEDCDGEYANMRESKGRGKAKVSAGGRQHALEICPALRHIWSLLQFRLPTIPSTRETSTRLRVPWARPRGARREKNKSVPGLVGRLTLVPRALVVLATAAGGGLTTT